MSTAAHAIAIPSGSFPGFAPKRTPPKSAPPIRRRSTPEQGRALEMLGHAIEYLVDSRLYAEWETPGDAAAVRTLMSCSREVFAECVQVHPWHQRVQKSLLRRLHLEAVVASR